MKSRLRRQATACLAAILVLVCTEASASARQAGEKRRDGPIPGPIIKLPPGQYDVTAPAAEGEQQQQQRRAVSSRAAQRWEYCAMRIVNFRKESSFSNQLISTAYIRYLRGGGESIDAANEDEVLAAAMTKLGDEGWELVAIGESFTLSDGNGYSTPRYFFKRAR